MIYPKRFPASLHKLLTDGWARGPPVLLSPFFQRPDRGLLCLPVDNAEFQANLSLTISLSFLRSHVLWAPNTASAPTFPGLANACARAQNANSGSEAWAEVQRQLSIVVMALEGAAATLEPVDDL